MPTDIKDYFLSGSCNQLVRDAGAAFKASPKGAATKMLVKEILSTQRVGNPLDGQVHAVVEGSGMGLSCSGDINDVCFFQRVEKNDNCEREVPSILRNFGLVPI